MSSCFDLNGFSKAIITSKKYENCAFGSNISDLDGNLLFLYVLKVSLTTCFSSILMIQLVEQEGVFSSLPLCIKAGLQLYFFLPTTKVFSVMFTFPNFLEMLKDSDLVYTPF